MNTRDPNVPTWELVLHAVGILALGLMLLVGVFTREPWLAGMGSFLLLLTMIEDSTDRIVHEIRRSKDYPPVQQGAG